MEATLPEHETAGTVLYTGFSWFELLEAAYSPQMMPRTLKKGTASKFLQIDILLA